MAGSCGCAGKGILFSSTMAECGIASSLVKAQVTDQPGGTVIVLLPFEAPLKFIPPFVDPCAAKSLSLTVFAAGSYDMNSFTFTPESAAAAGDAATAGLAAATLAVDDAGFDACACFFGSTPPEPCAASDALTRS